MTVNEVLEMGCVKGQYEVVEFYKGSKFHTDYCKPVTDISFSELENIEVKNWELMDQDDINSSIYANTDYTEDFEELYDNANAKILCILI